MESHKVLFDTIGPLLFPYEVWLLFVFEFMTIFIEFGIMYVCLKFSSKKYHIGSLFLLGIVALANICSLIIGLVFLFLLSYIGY